MTRLRKSKKTLAEKYEWKTAMLQDDVLKDVFRIAADKLRYWLQGLLLTLVLPVLGACGDSPLEKLNQQIEADAEARRGIYVNLSADLQTAIGTADSQTDIELRRTLIKDGSVYPLETLSIASSVASYKPPKTEASGEYRYDIQIWYQSAASDVRLLLAEASKTSDKQRVEFAADELYTAPYDRDGNGSVDASELKYLDDDEDSLPNLAEIVEGGNPQNSAPTFVSPANITLVENDDNSGYIFYTARAISARSDSSGTRLAITYGIDQNNTDSRITDLLNIDLTEGTLSILAGSRLPAYDNLVTANNEYLVTLTAADDQETGEMRLTLNITDIFNLTVTATSKALQFQWTEVVDNNGTPATYYQLLQDFNGDGDYILVTQKDALGKITQTQFTLDVALHLTALKPTTRYQLKAYRQPDLAFSATLIKTSAPLTLANALSFPEDIIGMIAYLKASNTGSTDQFGYSVALSTDGQTLAVGAIYEDGGEVNSGTVSVFKKTTGSENNGWIQQAVLKASNAGADDLFGFSVALSADGQTLAVGALNEDGAQRGVSHLADLDPMTPILGDTANAAANAGAVYLYRQLDLDATWQLLAYIKASNTGEWDSFGWSVALSADGQTLAVGAVDEEGAQRGVSHLADLDPMTPTSILGDTANAAANAGAVYLYRQLDLGVTWQLLAYIKASNTEADDRFGYSVALSADGRTLAVGAYREDGAQRGVSHLADLDPMTPILGDTANAAFDAGAVYLYRQLDLDATWKQVAYFKASNTEAGDRFGYSVALSADGQTLAVGAPDEDGAQRGVSYLADLDPMTPILGDTANLASYAGAVYLYRQLDLGATWQLLAYFKASNTEADDRFGSSVALSADGQTLAVGAPYEGGAQRGVSHLADLDPITPILGDTANSAINAGAVYLYRQLDLDVTWQQPAYLKASNTGAGDSFGWSVALSVDGQTLAVGAIDEDGGGPAYDCAANGEKPLPSQETNCLTNSGAVYLY